MPQRPFRGYATVPLYAARSPRMGSQAASWRQIYGRRVTLVAYFRGHAISCETVEDAVAIIRADTVFRDREVSRPREFRTLGGGIVEIRPLPLRRVAIKASKSDSSRAVPIALQLTGFELPKSQMGVGYQAD
jgi:hypothetical protein